MDRRHFVLSTAAAALGACAPRIALAQPRRLVYADMHSHIGILGGRADVREAMVANGMLVVARKIVADGPVIRRFPGKGVQQVREPAAGELAGRFDKAFERLKAEHKLQNLIEIVDGASLKRVLDGSEPGVVLAAEGADFIDGDLKRLEAARTAGLVHVQLVHYRISEIGDVSTERPRHNGLTPFGKQVLQACNGLGILVDIAHCTPDGMVQALELSTKPLIYSHGQMVSTTPHWTQAAARARAIPSHLARKVADKGGVIGLWPLASQFGSLDSYLWGLLDAVQAVGPAHVGVGTDLFGLGGSTVIPGYEQFAQLEELMMKRGLRAEDVHNILGGNYLRVLGQALAA